MAVWPNQRVCSFTTVRIRPHSTQGSRLFPAQVSSCRPLITVLATRYVVMHHQAALYLSLAFMSSSLHFVSLKVLVQHEKFNNTSIILSSPYCLVRAPFYCSAQNLRPPYLLLKLAGPQLTQLSTADLLTRKYVHSGLGCP